MLSVHSKFGNLTANLTLAQGSIAGGIYLFKLTIGAGNHKYKNMFNTWLVTGTINTDRSKWNHQQRFEQTVLGLKTIRAKDTTAKIIYVDNSLQALNINQIKSLQQVCDYFYQYPHNIFSKMCNTTTHFNKGLGELLMTEAAICILHRDVSIGKRIFKMCGRYQLLDSFDIRDYDDPRYEGKYVFKNVTWAYGPHKDQITHHKIYLETKLWSFCSSLVDEYNDLLPKILEYMLVNNENIEVSTNLLLPESKKEIISNLHVSGVYASGDYVEV